MIGLMELQMKKLRSYLVSISYEDKNEIFRHIQAKTKQEAELMIIELILIKDPKYNCRPLTSYKLQSCLEDYNRRK